MTALPSVAPWLLHNAVFVTTLIEWQGGICGDASAPRELLLARLFAAASLDFAYVLRHRQTSAMPVTTADYSKVDKARSSRTPWLRMMKHPAVWAIVVRIILGQQARSTAALRATHHPLQ